MRAYFNWETLGSKRGPRYRFESYCSHHQPHSSSFLFWKDADWTSASFSFEKILRFLGRRAHDQSDHVRAVFAGAGRMHKNQSESLCNLTTWLFPYPVLYYKCSKGEGRAVPTDLKPIPTWNKGGARQSLQTSSRDTRPGGEVRTDPGSDW